MADFQQELEQLTMLVMHINGELEALRDDVWREQNQVIGADDEDDDFPWSLVHLSTRLTAVATATIQAGSFWIGENAAVNLATSTRTINADLQYLWLEYNFDTNALTAATPSVTLPVSTSPVFVLPLAKFSFDGTTAAITDYLYLGGDFHLPGTWAA